MMNEGCRCQGERYQGDVRQPIRVQERRLMMRAARRCVYNKEALNTVRTLYPRKQCVL